MKKLLLFIILLIGISSVQAEDLKGTLFLGPKVGIIGPWYQYSYEGYDNYSQDITTKFLVGLSGEYFLTNYISFKPDLMYIGRGNEISEEHFKYESEVNYFEFDMPFAFSLWLKSNYNPYLLVGPYLGVATDGYFSIDDGLIYKTDVSDANVSPIDLGVRLGVGVRKKINLFGVKTLLGLELAYSTGLINTFSDDELDAHSYGLNQSIYKIHGTRQNRGIELSMSLLLSTWSPNKKDIEEIDDQPIGKKLNTSVGKSKIPEKYCYTIDEIMSYNEKGWDVVNRKICMYNIYFEHNKAVLKEDSKSHIDKVVKLMNMMRNIDVVIHGHTDSDGDEKYNLDLSERRSKAVYNYMVSRGIDKSRLDYQGHGEEQPIEKNNSKANKAKNRRVEFEILIFD